MTFSADEILQYRREKDRGFRTERDSPIPPHERHTFQGLKYYPPDPTYYVPTKLVPPPKPRTLVMSTSDGDERTYEVAGTFTFRIKEEQATLTAYRVDAHDESLFLPFKDTTAPKETYGAGRYIDLPARPPHSLLFLDFNLAYNPYCAYSDEFSCPFPPKENWLSIPISAGERNYREF
jgi:uncharacterized protein